MDSSFDSDDLSTAFGTETLAEREMVPEGFDNAPSSTNSAPIELVGGEWWDDNKTVYQTLYLWALDTLSIPAMATECERAFSSAKKLITPERNALADTTIEATECLKAWWDCHAKPAKKPADKTSLDER